MAPLEFSGKVILIYGGTSGIGKELVNRLVTLGANVIFTGTNKEKGSALEATLSSKKQAGNLSSAEAVFCQCDATDWASHGKLYTLAEERFGPVDTTVIVAGILESSDLLNDDEQESYRTIDINLTAAAKANRVAIQHFLKHKRPGCIVNTSSIYGFCGAPLAPLYTATKHAIIGLTRSYGSLFRSTDIRVNCVAPHFVDTPMVSGQSRKVASALGMVPMTRCIEAYMQAIQDKTLNGDILTVADKIIIEPRYTAPYYEHLDDLCYERKQGVLDQLLKHEPL
ncbi:hypothetical protein BCR43DRAFT_469545 [Syncephalastrum racemosum]|uniref:NAD(P)-binding protein n=1 Tax=Syncephalastrum racemosum TaxID=13706 RepID=A0A1X2HNY5_SYNRA|nr:hypothetical protein BCR43DRAFT_469545 [Syncephalastrum racemosum]